MISSQKHGRLWNPEWWGLYLSFLSHSFRNKPTTTWKDQRKPTDITPTAPIAPCGPRVHCHGNPGHMCCYLQALTSQRCQCHYTPILTQTGGAEGGGGGAKWQSDRKTWETEMRSFSSLLNLISHCPMSSEIMKPLILHLLSGVFIPSTSLQEARASCSAAWLESLRWIGGAEVLKGWNRLRQKTVTAKRQTWENVRCQTDLTLSVSAECPQNPILQHGAVIIFELVALQMTEF